MLHVFIIEPQPRVTRLLEGANEVRVVGCTSSLRAIPNHARACDFVLVSAQLACDELARWIHDAAWHLPSLVLVEMEENAAELVPLLEAGAAGYVRRGASANEFVATLRAIKAGKLPLAPSIGAALVTRLRELVTLRQRRRQAARVENFSGVVALTAREREILHLIRGGASNQQIAAQLTIELGTVKNHVHNILKKLNVTRREHAAHYLDFGDPDTG